MPKRGEADEDLDNVICLKAKRAAEASAEAASMAYSSFEAAMDKRSEADEDFDNVICLKARRNAEDASGLYKRFAEAISQVRV